MFPCHIQLPETAKNAPCLPHCFVVLHGDMQFSQYEKLILKPARAKKLQTTLVAL